MINYSVLVVMGYTDFKYYCRPLFPKNYESLTYKNKAICWVDEDTHPDLGKNRTGDVICAEIRRHGIKEAIKTGMEWVYFMDLDSIPEPDTLEKLLSINHPFVGGAVACRGDATNIIGHKYGSWEKRDRLPLNKVTGSGVIEVDGISGASMLVHKSIFNKVLYDGYTGLNVFPGSNTCDDEYYCIRVRQETGITPKMHLGVNPWHLHTDGFGYKWFGNKKEFKMTDGKIKLNGEIYG